MHACMYVIDMDMCTYLDFDCVYACADMCVGMGRKRG